MCYVIKSTSYDILNWNFSINILKHLQHNSVHFVKVYKYIYAEEGSLEFLNMTHSHSHTHTVCTVYHILAINKHRSGWMKQTFRKHKFIVSSWCPLQSTKETNATEDICMHLCNIFSSFVFFVPTNMDGKWNIKSDVSNLVMCLGIKNQLWKNCSRSAVHLELSLNSCVWLLVHNILCMYVTISIAQNHEQIYLQ